MKHLIRKEYLNLLLLDAGNFAQFFLLLFSRRHLQTANDFIKHEWKISRVSIWYIFLVSFRVNLIKFYEQKKSTPTTLLKSTERDKSEKARVKNFHRNFPIWVAKMYHVIRYGELSKWSCLSNEVIEYTKKAHRDEKYFNVKRYILLWVLAFNESFWGNQEKEFLWFLHVEKMCDTLKDLILMFVGRGIFKGGLFLRGLYVNYVMWYWKCKEGNLRGKS